MIARHRPHRLAAIAQSVSVVCTVMVVAVVNFLIYTVRWEFAARHPDYVAKQPATISRAISDPMIGDPFAVWMLICAPALFVGIVFMLTGFVLELMRSATIPPAGIKKIVALTAAVIVLQGCASTGMVLLSQFRFPDHDEMHMAGSYLFFFSQAFTVFCMAILSRCYDRLPAGACLPSPAMGRVRRSLIAVPVFLSVVYLALFVFKESTSAAWRDLIYQTYVTVELLLISSFLFFLLAWVPDTARAARNYWRS